MKIGHISYGYKPITGGQQTYIANLVKIFNEGRCSQRVYQSDAGINDPQLRPVPKLPKVLRYRAADIYAYNLFLLGRYRELKKEDVLIVHYAFHYPTISWHKNIIIVSHGVEWEEPPIRLNHRIRKKIAEVAFRGNHCKLVANDTDYFRKMGMDIKPKEGMFKEVAKDKWFIPNCVDTSVFQRNRGLKELKRLNPVLVPRNIVQRRGIDMAIRAFGIFVKKYPKANLVIVGGPANNANPVYSNLAEMVKQLKLEKKVIFWGPVSWEEMPSIYSSSSMALVPSTFGEGTSLSALESMACGTLTVATNVGGLADLPCVLTEPCYESLAETMLDCFEHRERIGHQQSDVVARVYNLDNWKRAWLKVIS